MRLKFQTKLMLAVALVAALVTALVISMTEDKVKDAYSQLAEQRFEEQVENFLEMRKVRLEGMENSLEKIASLKIVKERLATGDFNQTSLTELGRVIVKEIATGGGRLREGADKLLRFAGRPANKKSAFPLPANRSLICLVDQAGELHPLGETRFRRKPDNSKALSELRTIDNFNKTQAGYLIVEFDHQQNQLVEVVMAPVEKLDGGDVSGAVLLGQVVMGGSHQKKKPGEMPSLKAGRAGSKGGQMFSALMTEGEVFSQSMSEGMIARIKELVDEGLLPLGENRLQEELVVKNKGSSYRLFYERLNPDSTLPPAYQVVLYPLAQLRSDLMSLRIKGSGVGAAAMWFGVFLAWLLARRFARPIRELAVATKEIREGNYEVNIPVRSKDELGDLAMSFNEMAGELKTKEQIRDVLGKVADEAVAEALISGSLELGGEMRTVSILFCDIRGFTALSENMAPTDVIEMLNDHMTAMTRIVYEYRGVVDKFVGDEIMAVFGAPKTYGDDAENAALCAMKMIEERARLNQGVERPFEIGIGVATGSVVVGCIGATNRLNYTVIGERVNRAARLSGLAGPGQAVVDDTTWEAVAGQAGGEELENVSLKGYTGEVRAYLLETLGEAGLTQSH